MNIKLGHVIKSTHLLCRFSCCHIRVDLKNACSVFCVSAILTYQRDRLSHRSLDEPKKEPRSLRRTTKVTRIKKGALRLLLYFMLIALAD